MHGSHHHGPHGHHHHVHHHDHGPGHNHAGEGHHHLHSHPHGPGGAGDVDELKALAASLIDGFRNADDKTSFLRIAGIPFRIDGGGGPTLNLVDAAIVSNWQIGTASPGFASRELVYLPFPGDMVRSRETMTFTYVSLEERRDIDLLDLIRDRITDPAPNSDG